MFKPFKYYSKISKRVKFYTRIVGLRGLYYAIKARIFGSTLLFEMHRNDISSPLSLRIPSSDIMTYKQIFLRQDYEFITEEQPDIIIDAGANIGLASIFFANKYPNAKIIAIEPQMNNFELLIKNVESYSNIFPVQAALWNQNCEINLVDPGLGNWGFMTEEDNSAGARLGSFSHKVNAITVDKIIRDYKFDKIDILKIDIEGAEKEVFSDTSSWIENVDALIVELHERMKPGCNRSFYNGSSGFDKEWHQGENIYLSRGNKISPNPG